MSTEEERWNARWQELIDGSTNAEEKLDIMKQRERWRKVAFPDKISEVLNINDPDFVKKVLAKYGR